jgi:hypothetical protein
VVDVQQALWAVVAAAFLGVAAQDATAQDGAPIRIELNKLTPREGACEAYLVLRNPGGAALETLRLDLVMFDGDGVIARRLAVEAGPVLPDKTSVRAFLIDGLACEAVGTMLLNDVAACADVSGPRADCLGMLALDARSGLDFTM